MKRFSVILLVALTLIFLAVRNAESKKLTIEEAKKTIKNLRKVCSKKNDTPKALLDGQHRGEFPREESLMCYMRCIMTTTKTMKNDVIMFDWFASNARLMLEEEYIPRVDHIIEVCKPQVTATEGCEVAWQFGKCVFETDKELYLAP
ncbi:odorant binding protein 6 [Andrena cerasifolii]|uniref:odorant binding protein 6 n=1 Tax=Andrena cerasifolii TaxID=2819439 RepID=UPI004038485A